MPGLDGIAATEALRAAVPACRVLIVTTFGRPGYLRRAMAAGASGFMVKDAPAEQLADAIRRVHAGLRVVDPTLAAETPGRRREPADRARARGAPVASRDGGTVADIARALFLSEGTVRNHLSAAIGKTGARTRAEAARRRRGARLALTDGLIAACVRRHWSHGPDALRSTVGRRWDDGRVTSRRCCSAPARVAAGRAGADGRASPTRAFRTARAASTAPGSTSAR